MQPENRGRSGVRSGVLSGPVEPAARLAASYPPVAATPGTRVVHRASGFAGLIVQVDGNELVVAGTTGLERRLRNEPGAFLVDGQAVRLVAADHKSSNEPAVRVSTKQKTASGSRAVVGVKARVARESRILVEGVHDAELVEKVWGDDLRVEGVVVERLDGADVLADVVAEFGPSAQRRLGVLLDHMVEGSKESRLAARVAGPNVLVVGTPYVDVWQAVRPRALGIPSWPVVPKGTPWKEGVCAALGFGDPRQAWRRILASVHDWKDLEQSFVGAMERLIDFVTVG